MLSKISPKVKRLILLTQLESTVILVEVLKQFWETEMKLPVFPNWYPYNNMVFDKHLQIGDFAVKTRNWDWKYRGPVLFYTSGRVAQQAVTAYGYERNPSKHKIIVGVAELAEVRPLLKHEARQMVCNFNNYTVKQLDEWVKSLGLEDEPDWPFWINSQFGHEHIICPFPIGFFFKDAKRFKTLVPFNWPAGPVKPIFIQTARYPKLHAELLLAHHS